MPFAGGMSRCRVLYWPRHFTANSPPIVSNGLNTVGQCWLSQDQNFSSSGPLRFWKTRLYGYSFSQPSAPSGTGSSEWRGNDFAVGSAVMTVGVLSLDGVLT